MSVEVVQQISCDENLIAAYIDGELEAEQRLGVDQHLDDCDRCREELRVHRVVSAKLRQHENKNNVSELDQEGARAFKLKRAGKSTRVRQL